MNETSAVLAGFAFTLIALIGGAMWAIVSVLGQRLTDVATRLTALEAKVDTRFDKLTGEVHEVDVLLRQHTATPH